jgi:Uma2 family endonuclease
MAVVMPSGRPLTIDDLDRFPCDGNRYELVQGSLHVNPAPNFLHQTAVARLIAVLAAACPAHLHVLGAPFDVTLGADTLVQPDVLVVALSDVVEDRLIGPPVLVVEVLSPSTRFYDLGTKRLVYTEAGVPQQWYFDPDGPTVTVVDGPHGTHERQVVGDRVLHVDQPFVVDLVPADLIRPGGPPAAPRSD